MFCRDPTEYQSITNEYTAKRPCSLERPAVSCDSDWNCAASMEELAAGNIEGATARHEDEYEGSDNLLGENIEGATTRQDEYERLIDNLIGENEKFQEFTKDYDTSDISLPAPTAVSQDAQPFDSSLSRPVVIQKRGMFQYSVFRKLIKSR